MSDEDRKRAKDQAKAKLESIVAMVKRLEHCQNCDGEECDLTAAEIYEGLYLSYKEGEEATEDMIDEYHDEDKAREQISEEPLEVSVRSDWHSPGDEEEAVEYIILLCTGGPAVRIHGQLGIHGQPEDAQLEYQDWFTPWETYLPMESEEHDALLSYAQQFYFGE